MNKIMITGGSGLVGSAIKKIAENYDCQFIFLSSKDVDLTSLEDTKRIFELHHPEYVIHLAANVGGLFKNMHHKVDMLEKNLLINYNVIKCCHDFKVKKLVSCLSTCIFPDKVNYPIDESMLHNGPPHFSNDAYAYAKRMIEIHSKAYQEQYGDNFICVIPTNIYGENDNYHLEDAHVIPALIHKCKIAKESGKDFIVMGSGRPLRQFIYSEDLAKLIMWILENYKEKDSIILSPTEEYSIEQVAREIAKNFNYEHRIQFDTTASDGQYKKTVSNQKLLEHIGPNFEFTSLKDGIQKSVQWFIDNYISCRK